MLIFGHFWYSRAPKKLKFLFVKISQDLAGKNGRKMQEHLALENMFLESK
jgi:hypothetical protein